MQLLHVIQQSLASGEGLSSGLMVPIHLCTKYSPVATN